MSGLQAAVLKVSDCLFVGQKCLLSPLVFTALHGGAQRKEMFIKITLMFVFIPHSSVHPA
jgi:hypothetical protein